MESVVSVGEPLLKHKLILSCSIIFLLALLSYSIACKPAVKSGKKSIVVTYSILGAVVKDMVGDSADVTVSIPNGLDPHEWEPSAKDIEAINKADLVVQNGLGLESGMQKALQTAQKDGVQFFTASDYITVRHVGPGEGIPSGSPDQLTGAADPHLWMDPLAIKSVVSALAPILTQQLGLEVSARATDLETRLDALNTQIVTITSAVPAGSRKLVTGHESMGYFAQRYNFQLIGVIVPSLSTQADVSAADLAALKKVIQDNKVKAIFTELGTPANVAKQIGAEAGVKVVSLSTHILPADGSYFTFMLNVANIIIGALK
jgi:zinc/manganese transport system substrate-binding protein